MILFASLFIAGMFAAVVLPDVVNFFVNGINE